MISFFVLIVLTILAVPLFLLLIYFNVITISFAKLGLSFESALIILFISLIGGIVNIPIKRRKVFKDSLEAFNFFPFFYRPPLVSEQIICINFGGCLVPLVLSIYLLPKAPVYSTLICLSIVTFVTKFLARPVRGIGIILPAIVPPILAVLTSLIFAPLNPAVCAYISGTIGTLIGADILNLKKVLRMGPGIFSIGGAGVFDGIFLCGIISVFLLG